MLFVCSIHSAEKGKGSGLGRTGGEDLGGCCVS